MKLKILRPPVEAINCVKEKLTELAEIQDSKHLIRGNGLPHPVHTIGLIDIVNNNYFSKTEHIAWRFLLGTGSNAHAAIEIGMSKEKEEGHHFHHINRGPFVQGTLDAVKALEEEKGGEGLYELHVIRIPAIYIMAIWLKSVDDDENLFYVMEPAHHAVPYKMLIPESDFFDALGKPAAEQLEMDVSPDSKN